MELFLFVQNVPKKITQFFVFIFFFALLLYASSQRHWKYTRFDYQAQLFSDKAGYHVYLPALFYYSFDAGKMPLKIDSLTGNGFVLKDNRIITKYPLGVAIFQLPFFSFAAIVDWIFQDQSPYGYTDRQHRAIDIGTAFYMAIAMALLFTTFSLSYNHSSLKIVLSLLLILFASNLFYYSSRDAGMSHAYSFFCYSAMVFWLHRIKRQQNSYNLPVLACLIILAFFVRPINMLFILPCLAFYARYLKINFLQSVKQLFRNQIFWPLLSYLMLLSAQLAYNYYAFNKLTLDGYQDEGFYNLFQMDFKLLFFSPDNGLFIYSPIYLIVLLSFCWFYKNKSKQVIYLLMAFVAISLTYAAWNSPTLGCGFGHRGFTEFLAFFSLPFVFFVNQLKNIAFYALVTTSSIAAIILFIFQLHFDGCWHGANHYDWHHFFEVLKHKQY